MKKLTTLWMMLLMLTISIPAMSAMSMSKVRQHARFLTDRMAYELNLTTMQYNDVYEVNYDFIDNVRYIMDDVTSGYPSAVDRYYDYLDFRNDDLRWILSASQYRRFMNVDYFYRPIYTTASEWLFRIYRVYNDITHFYFGKPHHYKSYKGEHYRTHYGHVSFYKDNRKEHYKHDFYKGDVRVRQDKRREAPKVSSRPSPDRKQVNSNPANRKESMREPQRNTNREPRKEVNRGSKLEVNKQSKSEPRKEVNRGSKPEVNKQSKSEPKRESNRGSDRTSSRTSQKDKQEGRRAARTR